MCGERDRREHDRSRNRPHRILIEGSIESEPDARPGIVEPLPEVVESGVGIERLTTEHVAVNRFQWSTIDPRFAVGEEVERLMDTTVRRRKERSRVEVILMEEVDGPELVRRGWILAALELIELARDTRVSREHMPYALCSVLQIEVLVGEQRLALRAFAPHAQTRSEEHTSELQSRLHLVCRLLLEK